jgi:hypothetical protein
MLQKKPEIGLYILTLLALSIFWGCYYYIEDTTIAWQALSTLHKSYTQQFQQIIDGQTYTLPQAVYWVTESFRPSWVQQSSWANYLALACFALLSSGVLAAGSTLKKWPFYLLTGLGLLGLGLVSLDQVLGANGSLWSLLYLTASVLCVGAFYVYFTRYSLAIRVSVFMVIQLVFIALVYKKGGLEGLELWGVKSYFVLYFWSHIGLFFLGFGIPLYILKIASSAKSKYGLLNFIMGMVLYMATVYLLDWQDTQGQNLLKQYLTTCITVSIAVLAVLCYMLLELPKIFANYQAYSWVIFVSIITSLLTFSIGFNTLNDSLILELTAATSTVFLWVGVGFGAYVLVNFLPLFIQNLNVAQVLFKPKIVPFGYFAFGMVFLVVGIWLGGGFYNWNQLKAAQLVALGGHSEKYENYTLAEAYYKGALKEDYTSYRASFSLGSMAQKLGDTPTAGSYYRQAAKRKYMPMGYAAWAQSLLDEDLYFDALFAYREGIRAFPNSAELLNNMALVFHKAKAADSCLAYLTRAHVLKGKAQNVVKTNQVAMELFYPNLAQVNAISLDPNESYNSLISNTLAKGILNNEPTNAVYVPIKSIVETTKPLSIADFALLVNTSTYQGIKTQKTGNLLNLAKLQALDPAMKLDLQEAFVQGQFLYGNKLAAIDTLQNMTYADSAKASFLASWQKTALKIAPDMPANISTDCLENIAQNPLNELVVNKNIAIANKQNKTKEVHSLLLQGIRIFPENTSLLKAYIGQCFLMNVPKDAEEAMQKLQELDPNIAMVFTETYQKQKDAYYKKLAFE